MRGGYTTAFPRMDAVPIAPLSLTEEEQNDLVEFFKDFVGGTATGSFAIKTAKTIESGTPEC